MRFSPTQDEHSNWRIADRGLLMPGKCVSQDHAVAHADLMNAIDEGEPANVINDLRRDRDNAREGQ
ncbi:hypothetical protein [Kribbella sp. NPDC050470]|uniref:hypothetical protein n=1 Tax=unclassified Kribbella TaxID=2644121 RepID=UPI0037AB63A1